MKEAFEFFATLGLVALAAAFIAYVALTLNRHDEVLAAICEQVECPEESQP